MLILWYVIYITISVGKSDCLFFYSPNFITKIWLLFDYGDGEGFNYGIKLGNFLYVR